MLVEGLTERRGGKGREGKDREKKRRREEGKGHFWSFLWYIQDSGEEARIIECPVSWG